MRARLPRCIIKRTPPPSSGAPEDYKYTYGELKEIKTGLTSEELTSFLNYNRPKYYALKKVSKFE